ncbi:MAG: TldD/PmbA family protein [Candidatus Margulisbacteria bacterium]|nr:TldD/PmbA family protein [Candidatus Margulisiibacteriota bacterium]
MNKAYLSTLIKTCKSKGATCAEAYYVSSFTTKVDVLNQEVESIDEMKEMGLALRVIKDGKLGFVYSSNLEAEDAESLAGQALHNAGSSSEDKFNLLPSPTDSINGHPTNYYDPAISQIGIEEKIKLARAMEVAAYDYDERIKKTEKVSFSDSELEVWILNSRGIDAHYKANYCGGMAEVIALEDGGGDAGMGIDFVTLHKNFDAKKIGEEAGRSATQLLGAGPIPSQKMNIILEPKIGAELLGIIASSFSADNVQKGKSLFAGQMEKTVASGQITIIDDGMLKEGIATTPFDAEGVPTQETALVEGGVLKGLLHNAYTAAKDGVSSTGNSQRGSFKTLPGISASNIYIKPGPHLAAAIISKCQKGLYVTRVMGLHTANPITGEFSFGASGILVENGIKTKPVKGITIAGNLIEMLKQVEAVGSDLRFVPYSANLGSPTLLITGISVSGS